MMARSSNAPSMGRIQKRKTNLSKSSLSACNARPVHTEGPTGDLLAQKRVKKISRRSPIPSAPRSVDRTKRDRAASRHYPVRASLGHPQSLFPVAAPPTLSLDPLIDDTR